MKTQLFNFDMVDDVTTKKQKILFITNQISWMILSVTDDMFPMDMKQPGMKVFVYDNNLYSWSCECNIFDDDDKCCIIISINDNGYNVYQFTIDISPCSIKHDSYIANTVGVLQDSELIKKYTNELIRICDTYKQYLNNTTTKRIQQTNHYLLLKAGFHVSKDYITDTITLDKLVSLDYDDINYTKTIYRISEDDMIPTIEKTIKEKWMLGKQYRFETTKVNKLFYVENMDVQDISEYDGDTLMDLIDDGYKIINVIEE